jgi:hypothetical protein
MEHTEKGSGEGREGKHGLRPVISIDRTLVFHKTDRRHLKKERKTFISVCNTWVISKVLHTVLFLFKNKFILQNTFTGLQCNLHCALSQQSSVWASLMFLSGCLRC